MAGEQLRTAQELLDSFPDNTGGLIEAVDSRDFVVSITPGIGAMEEDPAQTPYVIPLVAGVPVSVPGTLIAPQFAGNYWALDGNNAMVPDYGAINVPPAHLRLVTGLITMKAAKVGGATESYIFIGSNGGIATGDQFEVELTSTPQTFTMVASRLYDVTLGNPVSFTVQSAGGSSLEVHHVRYSLESALL